MNMELIKQVTSKQIKQDIPDFRAGDTVKVHVRIVEGNKERIQTFQGVVISKRGSGISESFIVRKMSSSVGVERVFQIHSPLVAKIEVVKYGSVRRNKLYYLRKRSGKGARIAENRKLTTAAQAASAKVVLDKVEETKIEEAPAPVEQEAK